MFVFYDWPFPHMCTLQRTQPTSLLILGSVFGDCVVFYGDYNQAKRPAWKRVSKITYILYTVAHTVGRKTSLKPVAGGYDTCGGGIYKCVRVAATMSAFNKRRTESTIYIHTGTYSTHSYSRQKQPATLCRPAGGGVGRGQTASNGPTLIMIRRYSVY